MTARYAIYYYPRVTDPLQVVGNRWLGRDPESGVELPPPEEPVPDWRILTATPRHYGLHATLKPPFRLRPGAVEADLRDALGAFAARARAGRIDGLQLGEIGGFLALLPASLSAGVQTLAAQCVRHFDRFRAPPTSEETAKRLARPLTPRQQVLTAEWGYPYVLDEHRFHITLTEPIEDPVQRERVRRVLVEHFQPVLAQPVEIADLCLFAQVDRQAAFGLVERFRLQP